MYAQTIEVRAFGLPSHPWFMCATLVSAGQRHGPATTLAFIVSIGGLRVEPVGVVFPPPPCTATLTAAWEDARLHGTLASISLPALLHLKAPPEADSKTSLWTLGCHKPHAPGGNLSGVSS